MLAIIFVYISLFRVFNIFLQPELHIVQQTYFKISVNKQKCVNYTV